MWVKIFYIHLTLAFLMCFASGQQNYELEFLEEGIFKACKNYPNKSIKEVLDFSNAHFGQTEDGSLLLEGYCILKMSTMSPQPILIEIFKKVRGTWQPTIMTQKRPDFCTALFDESEGWYPYFKNTPKEQRKCPLNKGDQLDLDINEPVIISAPERNGEGEYNIHVEVGDKTKDLFFCIDIPAMVHKA